MGDMKATTNGTWGGILNTRVGLLLRVPIRVRLLDWGHSPLVALTVLITTPCCTYQPNRTGIEFSIPRNVLKLNNVSKSHAVIFALV